MFLDLGAIMNKTMNILIHAFCDTSEDVVVMEKILGSEEYQEKLFIKIV